MYQEVLKKQYNIVLPIEELLKCVRADDSSLQADVREELDMAVDLQQVNGTGKDDACSGVRELIEAAYHKGLNIALAPSSTREGVTTH